MTSSHGHHAYHLVDMSPWPLTGSISAMMLTTGLVKWFHQFNPDLLILGVIATTLTMIQWWRDITREGTYQGLHTKAVTIGLRWGMILFITSEVLFFFSFFWAFFHSSLSPNVEVGSCWPPAGIQPFNPFQIPLLNTAILLASGATVTWAHHAIMESNHTQAIQGLSLTVILGLYFTALQALEYYEAPFTIADSVYGSTFFVATGFHGLHVIIGSSFLFVCLYRLYKCHFSSHHHFGFEAAAWYWHFVDVVWLFLYISIYWWGG
uniref:Cytochrome c oxidase subunit 3 n=1 Tax=Metapenaeopsis dalei TaxID=467289 RepID=A0A125R7H6_9EUCA|nr:cytochrome c oxidase subunit III [Metapenaeopsis dalei]AMD15643.1 cytochrome c oxidase subunit III [Metapenaeopsis dalei]